MNENELTEKCGRLNENIAMYTVEVVGTFSSELEMLDLVLPHWHMCSPFKNER